MPLGDLLKNVGQTTIAGDPGVLISGLSLDSRSVEPGFLFAALRGERGDGLDHVADALARGAVAVLADRPRPEGHAGSWVHAEDGRAALACVARSFYGSPDEALPVIGVTGTNGKTTVAYLLEAIVQASGGLAGVIGTISYRLGGQELRASRTTPEADSLCAYLRRMVDQGCSHAVIEVSSHALAQKRVHGLRFVLAVFTNLTQDHLDFHGTMERYFEAKSLLFRSLSPGSTAILNVDDPAGARLASLTRARVVTYGLSEGAEFRMTAVQSSFEGARFTVHRGGRSHAVATPMPGLPNAYNAAAALAAASSLGLPEDAALRAIRAFQGAPGRFERIERGQDFRVIVDYAHTDDALANLLGTVRSLRPGRILLVFGCGGDRDRSKRPLMGAAAARGSDLVLLTSDNPRSENPETIMDDAEAGLRMVPGSEGRFQRISDRRAAIAAAIALANAGDAVVIAGKGHEDTQILADRTIPFDDRVVAAECLDLRLGRA